MLCEEISEILPPVLVDIVLEYAYDTTRECLADDLEVYNTIDEMHLPFFMMKSKIWSWKTRSFVKSPLMEYLPLVNFDDDITRLFDFDACYCFLLSLDFRRRIVRTFGTRDQWVERLMHNYLSFEPFGGFYRMILHIRESVMKKRWYLTPYI